MMEWVRVLRLRLAAWVLPGETRRALWSAASQDWDQRGARWKLCREWCRVVDGRMLSQPGDMDR